MEDRTQSFEQFEPQKAESPATPLRSTHFSAPIAFFAAILLITASLFSGIQIGKKQTASQFPEVTLVAPTPTQSVVTQITTPEPIPFTSDPIENWKTLTNENGYSLKYPNSLQAMGISFEVTLDETNAPGVIIATKPGDPHDNSAALNIDIVPKVGTVFKDKTLSEISHLNYDANLANPNTFKHIVTPIHATFFDGKAAYTYTVHANAFSGKWAGYPVNGSLDSSENLTVIETENKGNYFTLVYSADDPTTSAIVSSFKFTK